MIQFCLFRSGWYLTEPVSGSLDDPAQGALHIVSRFSVFKRLDFGSEQNLCSVDAEGIGQSGNLVADVVQERRIDLFCP